MMMITIVFETILEQQQQQNQYERGDKETERDWRRIYIVNTDFKATGDRKGQEILRYFQNKPKNRTRRTSHESMKTHHIISHHHCSIIMAPQKPNIDL